MINLVSRALETVQPYRLYSRDRETINVTAGEGRCRASKSSGTKNNTTTTAAGAEKAARKAKQYSDTRVRKNRRGGKVTAADRHDVKTIVSETPRARAFVCRNRQSREFGLYRRARKNKTRRNAVAQTLAGHLSLAVVLVVGAHTPVFYSICGVRPPLFARARLHFSAAYLLHDVFIQSTHLLALSRARTHALTLLLIPSRSLLRTRARVHLPPPITHTHTSSSLSLSPACTLSARAHTRDDTNNTTVGGSVPRMCYANLPRIHAHAQGHAHSTHGRARAAAATTTTTTYERIRCQRRMRL